MQEKLNNLKSYLKSLGSVAIAFSSGVDSTFLLKVAHDVLGDNAIAITVRAHSFPKREMNESSEFCKSEGIQQFFCDVNEMDIPGFAENPRNRCYLCKNEIFTKIIDTARQNGIVHVCEGSNMDDLGDYRPGLQAVAELGIKSPLRECQLYKNEIRTLSKEMNLPTWQKPSFACLASRFVYGEKITSEKLDMVDKAEQFLLDLGLMQERVRIHGTLARIEVLPEEFDIVLEHRQEISSELKKIGFSYVALDLQGYRTGSMNETLKK